MSNIFDEFAVPKPVEDVALDSITLSQPRGFKVPNKFPTLSMPYRIAIIGEAPGEDEEHCGEPFVGMSGKLLTGMLSKAGIVRDACFIGNICQYRPVENDISNFSREGDEITEGLTQLKDDLQRFAPNICLLLGKTALWAFAGHDGIGNWRGSLGFSPEWGYKYISAYHPAACLRQYDWTAYLWFDLLKCKGEALTPIYTPPQYNFKVNLSFEDLLQELTNAQADQLLVSSDIEGYWDNLKCISFAKSRTDAFIVPFTHANGSSFWTEDQEVELWTALAKVLSDPNVPKVWQNGLYDRFAIQYGHKITVRGNVDDTMLKWAEWLCELEKGLDVQASILTKQPYWKVGRKALTDEEFFTYCCVDAVVTYEINEKLNSRLDPAQTAHYQFNNTLLNPILYMELKGIKYDTKLANKRLRETNQSIYTLQARLDAIAGFGISKDINRDTLRGRVCEVMCYKKDGTTPKKEFQDDFDKVIKIVLDPAAFTDEVVGYINIACKWSMNIKSNNFKKFIYTTLNLPKQYDPKTKALTTDYEALLKISKKQPHEAVTLALELGELRTRSQMLEIHADPDGRIRCGYNIVGTETGRITCYTSPTGSGYNLQTIPDTNNLKKVGNPLREGLRNLFVADEGYYLFQCDLKGSDGWTVGAHLAALGDPTMLEDLKADIKPAARICFMLRHGNDSLRGKDRKEVKELLKEIAKDSWDYFACKCGIWGTCYTMGYRKVDDLILVQSEGMVSLGAQKAQAFQQAVFSVYNIHLWHRWMERKLREKPELVSPNGHKRRFFGRAAQILGQALAHEPQVNTTYATNKAAFRLWTDPDNKMVLGPELRSTLPTMQSTGANSNRCVSLRIQPLHQVHDALIGQFRIEDTDFAKSKLHEWFNNPIQIAKTTLIIPFSGTYGESWGSQDVGKI